MTDYSQGKIYVIKSPQTDAVYIGSTVYTLEERFNNHLYDYNSWLNKTGCYITSFEIIKYDDACIELLEEYPCNSKKELELEEGKYQRIMKCVNKRIAGRTDKQYREDNKEQIKQRCNKYYQNNKEKIIKKNKEWYEKNKEEYNKKRKKYSKELYQKIKNRPKIMCVCGKEIRRDNKRRHEKSIVHIKYIEEMKENGDIDNVTEFFEQFRISYKSH
jgi:hypothetical protein